MTAALRDLEDAGALGLAVVELDRAAAPPPAGLFGEGIVRVGVHRHGALPTEGLEDFDMLMSADPDAPAPWVGASEQGLGVALAQLQDAAARQPLAATVAAQVCRMTLAVSFDQAFALESLGYSMLLASESFLAWRAATSVRHREGDDGPRVCVTADERSISIRLTRPKARNAVDARMRDALAAALDDAAADPLTRPVILSGEGPAFSAGGDLDEFGQADDVGRAHAIRVLRYSTRRIGELGPRVTARLHGACVGAGIEIPAAAGRVLARPGAFFRLPEVSMGLIPGAGGTASIPRRIGRHRACYMAISGVDIDVATALRWRLVDAVDHGP
jgi:enoyl-CoA hydratase/carnithine racemase